MPRKKSSNVYIQQELNAGMRTRSTSVGIKRPNEIVNTASEKTRKTSNVSQVDQTDVKPTPTTGNAGDEVYLPDDEKWKKALNKCFKQLIENMDPEGLLICIIEKGIFTQSLINDIRAKKDCPSEANEKILFGVKRRGHKVYTQFKECLGSNKQMNLVEALETEERKLGIKETKHSKDMGRSVSRVFEQDSMSSSDNSDLQSTASTSNVEEAMVEESIYNSPDLMPYKIDNELTEAGTSDMLETKTDQKLPQSASDDVTTEAGTSDMLEKKTDQKLPQSASDDATTEAGTSDMLETKSDQQLPQSASGYVTKDSNIKLRGYQRELVDKIKSENAIICLGTGTGKTIVALQMIKDHIVATKGQGRVAFMAVTGILVKQQADICNEFLPEYRLKTKNISGEDGDSKNLNAFIQNYNILFFTPQILVNCLNNENVKSLTAFSFLVFDECHHTKGDTPYSNLMRKYLIEKLSGKERTRKLPQILGLTASVGVGRSKSQKEAEDYIISVCARMDVRMLPKVEEFKDELKEYTATSTEETFRFEERKDDPCKAILLSAIKTIEKDILLEKCWEENKILTLVTNKCPSNKESVQYIQWTLDLIKEAESTLMRTNPEDARDIISCARYLNTFSSALEVNRLLKTKDVLKSIHQKCDADIKQHKDRRSEVEVKLFNKFKEIYGEINSKCRDVVNPNINKMTEKLHEMIKKERENSRAMVFVKTRSTCISLAKVFEEDLKDTHVKVSPLYGKGNWVDGDETVLTEDDQNNIVARFRDGYYKVLVTTAIGTEGIDIPNCNLALIYDYAENEVKKIQMKGRSRKADGSIMTIASETTKKKEEINVYKMALMQHGLDLARRSLSREELQLKILSLQKEEVDITYRSELVAQADKDNQKANIDCEMKCKKCGDNICKVSDLRKVAEHHHVVIDKTFCEKVVDIPFTPKKYDGFESKCKLCCKRCQNQLAVSAEIEGISCQLLMAKGFIFNSLAGQGSVNCSKWSKVPYVVPQISVDELKTLLSKKL